MIGVWIADLFREISLITKLIGWVENRVSKWKLFEFDFVNGGIVSEALAKENKTAK